MEPFLLKTLKKIRKESPRRLKQLVSICDKLVDELANPTTLSTNEQISNDELPNRFYEPLQICCESKIPRLMDISLDAFHYMMEHGYFRGSWLAVMSSDGNVANGSLLKLRTRFGNVINMITSCGDETDDTVQLQVMKALLTAVTSVYCEVHETTLLLSIRTCFNIHLVSKNSVNKATAKAALTQMLSAVNQRMEKLDLKLRSDAELIGSGSTDIVSIEVADAVKNDEESGDYESSESNGNHNFLSIAHKDAFLVFRALCKLSMKGLNDGAGGEGGDLTGLQNRVLSLELILHTLQHSGPAFRSGEKFIQIIRQLLCVSLLRNCTSQIPQITSISLQIFVCLMDGFKDHLKHQLEVFVANIFIRILESENATFDHKTRVLEVFHILCTEPSALVEIFINYDCDMQGTDLFRRIVDGLSKISKNPSIVRANQADFMAVTNNKRLLYEEHNLRVQGLEGLVIILRTLLRTANLWQGIGELPSYNHEGSVSFITSRRRDSDSMSNPYAAIASVSFEQQHNATASSTIERASSSDGFSISGTASETGAGATSQQGDAYGVSVFELFDRKQKKQEEIETGILKFNLSPKQGLKYLASLGHIEHTPKGVANFLRQYQDRLDKTAVGEYLGREREYEGGFCILVLHEYVEFMEFSGMAFDLAIRLFLSGFRLPGEAQKIDRLMEKFAERYYLQNRDNFASADMAFILAFSTIMLQTNLHNPAIREDKRMTKEQFIKQNKGISQDGELCDELLIEIYDRIAAQPISITTNEREQKKIKKEENSGFTVFHASFQDRRRKEAFDDERKEMVRASEEMFRQSLRKENVFLRTGVDTSSDEAYARPMFEVAWPPILGVMSQLLETYDDPSVVEICLRSFKFAIRLACRLEFSTARNTLVNALSKFTTLDTIRAMESKHIESIKAFMEVVLVEGDWLDETWNPVLQTISQLARLQMLADGSQVDEIFINDSSCVSSLDRSSGRETRSNSSAITRRSISKSNNGFSVNMDQIAKMFSGPSRAEVVKIIEEANADIIAQEINFSSIDKVYVNSHFLSEQSVYHFVKSLCEVSMLEISGKSSMNSFRGRDGNIESNSPRVFSLQKLVEVADFNMGSRPRMVWANIWNLLATHFTSVGMHENHAIAMFAVDSLKQLSIKFLQKEELSNFNFQRVFLKPFEIIITHSPSLEIKDLILRCVDIMILACATNIRSGWKSIFGIFEATANDVVDISNISFTITERLIVNNFDLLVNDFVELMNCLVSFVRCSHTDLSVRALDHLAHCSQHLASGLVVSVSSDSRLHSDISTVHPHVDEDAAVFRVWWPLLLGLSTAVGDSRLLVRVRALETLAKVLHHHGSIFSPQAWGMIFKGILFPMIDSAKTDFTPQPESQWPTQNPTNSNNKQSWIGTMAVSVFNICIELFKEFEERASPVLLLSDLLKLIEGCISQETESLARIAVLVYKDLIVSLGVISVETAELICSRLSLSASQSLCLDFGDLGSLDFVEDTPSYIVEKLQDCPVSARSSKEDRVTMRIHSDNIYSTPFGPGRFEKLLDRIEYLGLDQRWLVSLEWGARLYTCDQTKVEPQLKLLHVAPKNVMSLKQNWRKVSAQAMSSMVVTLDLIKCISEVIDCHKNVWRIKQLQTFLETLELIYWHARSFNENQTLRYHLWKRGFMKFNDDQNAWPHLLEQEMNSLSLILDIVSSCYKFESSKRTSTFVDSKEILKTFAYPKLSRFGGLVFQYYVKLELELTEESNNASVLQEKLFLGQKHKKFTNCVTSLLRTIGHCTEPEFEILKSWLIPELSQLVLCDDRLIRSYVSNIYAEHVNHLLISPQLQTTTALKSTVETQLAVPLQLPPVHNLYSWL